MAQPTATQRHISRPLTNMSIAYVQRRGAFIAGEAFPIVPVDKQTDKYFIYDKAYWSRTDVEKRGPATEAPTVGYELSNSNYYCDVFSVARDLDPMDTTNSDSPLDDERDSVEFITQQLLQKRERDCVSAFFTTSVWTGSSSGSDITPSTTWDSDASVPIEDIDGEKEALLENTNGVAVPENLSLILGNKVFRDLKEHPDILDRIKYMAGPGNPAIANEQTLAALFGVRRVLVPRAVKNTAAEGATASYSMIWGKRDALLVYRADGARLRDPHGGVVFTWNGLLGAGAGAPQISRKRDEMKGVDGITRIEGNISYDFVVAAATAGVFFSSAVAA